MKAILLMLLGTSHLLCVPAITEDDFYVIGSGAINLPRGDDVAEEFTVTDPPFTFYGTNFTTFFISTNGRISIGERETTDYKPRELLTNGIFAAPFWSDVDTGKENFQLGNVKYGVTRDPATIASAQNQIRNAFSEEQSFTPSYLVIATWEEVGYYVKNRNENTTRNTFQCVLLTNGMSSFVIFQYPKNGLNWTAGDTHGENGFFKPNQEGPDILPAAIAGFNYKNSTFNATAELPGSGTDAVRNLTDTSNIGIPGVWIYQVDETSLIDPDTTEAVVTTTGDTTTDTNTEAETTAEANTANKAVTTAEAETTAKVETEVETSGGSFDGITATHSSQIPLIVGVVIGCVALLLTLLLPGVIFGYCTVIKMLLRTRNSEKARSDEGDQLVTVS